MSVKIVGAQINHFVMDFEDLKECAREICEALDHKTLIASQDADIQIEETETGDVKVIVVKSGKRYSFPKEDVAIIPVESVSAEDLCTYLLNELCNKLDLGAITEVSVRLDEGLGQGAGSVRYFSERENEFCRI
jgi:6-pyruvoyltetrahydropterin/6-carboxytetrahydropterin synthase